MGFWGFGASHIGVYEAFPVDSEVRDRGAKRAAKAIASWRIDIGRKNTESFFGCNVDIRATVRKNREFLLCRGAPWRKV